MLIASANALSRERANLFALLRLETFLPTSVYKHLVPTGQTQLAAFHFAAFKSFKISRLALKPGAPVTPPPG